MFFGFSRKLRGLNRRKRKRSNKHGKHNKHNTSVKPKNKFRTKENVRFKIEEIDETPTTNTIKTVHTESLTPIVLSDSESRRSQIQRKKTRSVKSRTPTPYPRESNTTYTPRNNDQSRRDVSTRQLNTSGDVVLFFMNMLTTVKLYHWKTMNYATHKATDELYEDLNKYVDEFVEVMIGHKGGVRATLPRTNVKIYDCASKEEFSRKIEEYKEVLVGFTSRFGGKKNSDLLNIRDEILGALNKSLYVMSFK